MRPEHSRRDGKELTGAGIGTSTLESVDHARDSVPSFKAC
jgi:hypothetical protein